MKKPSRYGKFLVYLVVVVLINLVAATLFVRFDLTGGRVYSLSKVSRESVATLSEPLTINVFFTRNLPAPYNSVEQYLKDLLAEYALHANTYFNYRFFDVSAEGDIDAERTGESRKLADAYGINPVQIQVVEKDEMKFKKAYMGLVVIHGDMVERIPTITRTDGLEYTLTTAIQRLSNKTTALLGLKDKVQVHLYLSSSLQDVSDRMGIKDIAGVPDQVKQAVEELNGRMFAKLDYAFSDPRSEAEIEELSRKYNLMTLKWGALDGGKVPAGSAVIGLVARYGDRAHVIPVLQAFSVPLFGTQYKLTDMKALQEGLEQGIESLIGINETLGYLSGKGTLEPSGAPGSPASLANFHGLVSRTYSIREVSLDKGVPEGTGCLLIVRPTEPFSEYDLYQIDQALMKGTNLAVFLDPFIEAAPPGGAMPQQGQLMPVDTGLDKLLAHYGIGVRKSLALDEKCFRQRMPEQYGGGEQALYFAPIIEGSQINTDPAYMKNIRELITYKIAPLTIDEALLKKHSLKATTLFTTSESAWEMKGQIMLNPMFIRPPVDPAARGRLPLACMVEGSFPSYFAGKPVPERPAAPSADAPARDVQGVGTPGAALGVPEVKEATLASSKPARIFLIGSSEMITDNLVSEQGENTNATFVMNVIDVLNDRLEIALMRSKTQAYNPLQVTGDAEKVLAKAFNIAGLPLLVIVAGLLVWLRRHSRRKRIEAAFAEGGKA